jgi:hypothetical protein
MATGYKYLDDIEPRKACAMTLQVVQTRELIMDTQTAFAMVGLGSISQSLPRLDG